MGSNNDNEDYLDRLLAGALNHNITQTLNEREDMSPSYFGVENNQANAANEKTESVAEFESTESNENIVSDILDDSYDPNADAFEDPEAFNKAVNVMPDIPIVSDNPYENMSQEELADFLAKIGGADIIKPQAHVEPTEEELVSNEFFDNNSELMNAESLEVENNDEVINEEVFNTETLNEDIANIENDYSAVNDFEEELVPIEEIDTNQETDNNAVSLSDLSNSPNEMMSQDDIASLLAQFEEDAPTEEAVIEEAPIEEASIEEVQIEEAPVEEPASAVTDDPNKMMSPDDIAALIAGMGGEEAPIEEVQIEEVPAEEPASVVSDDPNKMMSPDDIAALIAGMGGEEAPIEEVQIEEVPAEEPASVVTDDPNKMMSPDDIAALITGMGGEEAIAEEAPIEEASVEEPASVVSDDPNKMMSPDDIAALIAGMDGEEAAAEETPIEEVPIEEAPAEEPVQKKELTDEEIDKEADELMSLLMDDDSSYENDDLDSLDFSEEDILRRLENAKSEGEQMAKAEAASFDENADIVDLADSLGLDGEIGDIAGVLKKSDNSQLVDASIADKGKKVKAFDPDEEENEEDNQEANGKKGKKKPKKEKKEKKGLFDFFKKKKKEENTSDEEAKEEAVEKVEVEKAPAKKKEKAVSEFADVSDELGENAANNENVVSLDDIFAEHATEDPDYDPNAPEPEYDEPEALAESDSDNESSDNAEGKADNKEEKKEKKKGFFQKLFDALTEEVQEEDEASQIKLSDENKQIIADLDGEEDGGKKKKKKKEKPPKEKKEKKKKEKKPKKDKKEKLKDVEDNSKKIPKKHVAITVILAASIFAVIMLVVSFLPKGMVLADGREAYYSGDYKEAFLNLYGKDLNESDKLLYDRAKTIVILDRKYESYINYINMGMRYEALNSLLEGIEKYTGMKEYAEEIGVGSQIEEVKNKIVAALNEDFGMSESEAFEVIDYSKLDYTLKLDSVINGTPFEKAQDMINEKYGLGDAASKNDAPALPELEDMLPEEKEYYENQNSSDNQSGENANEEAPAENQGDDSQNQDSANDGSLAPEDNNEANDDNNNQPSTNSNPPVGYTDNDNIKLTIESSQF